MKIIHIVNIVLLALCFYLYYPIPTLSPRLQAWYNRGTFLHYKEYKVFYIDETGEKEDGKTLICLHGFPTSSYDWMKIHDKLIQSFSRVIFMDFLGFGFSDKPRHHNYSILEQADIVESLLELHDIKSYHILAHDIGDTVALELLARQSKQDKATILSLAMMNGGIFPETNFPRPIQKLLLVPGIGAIVSKMGFFYLFKFSFSEIFGENKPTEEDLIDFWAAMEQQHGCSINHRLLKFIPERTTYRDRWVGALKRTKIPVNFIYGPADCINPPGFIEYYMDMVPAHRISVLDENVGHYPQWEAPDEVMHVYTQFLHEIRK